MRSFVKLNLREMAKSFCRYLIQVNHAFVAILNVANMSFDAFRDNKILAKKFRIYCIWYYLQYGFVNYALQLLVMREFGKETWEKIK